MIDLNDPALKPVFDMMKANDKLEEEIKQIKGFLAGADFGYLMGGSNELAALIAKEEERMRAAASLGSCFFVEVSSALGVPRRGEPLPAPSLKLNVVPRWEQRRGPYCFVCMKSLTLSEATRREIVEAFLKWRGGPLIFEPIPIYLCSGCVFPSSEERRAQQ